MKKLLLLSYSIIIILSSLAQNVGIGTTTPDVNAILHLESNNKGLLLPSISSTDRNAMVSPPGGLIVYDYNTKSLWMRGATSWQQMQTFSSSHWTEIDGNLHRFSRVGIGTGAPLATLHVKDSSVLFAAPALSIDPGVVPIPVSGGGTRMMWLPQKSAFRAGTVSGSFWDASQVGSWSTAFGINTKASGVKATAMGDGTTASGLISTAMGFGTTASQSAATAMGNGTIAGGASSTAMGEGTNASAGYSTAMGVNTTASGLSSTAMGGGTLASGNTSTAIGQTTKATGDFSLAAGANTTARSYISMTIGRYNDSISSSQPQIWVPADPLFIIGNGTSTTPNNAMVVYKNGNLILKNSTTVSGDPPSFTLPVNGEGTRMMWIPEKGAFRVGSAYGPNWDSDSIGYLSFAAGPNPKATAPGSIALGNYASATGNWSTAIGKTANASGESSTAIGNGTIAGARDALALGFETKASGTTSTTMGAYTIASGAWATALGTFSNASGTSSLATGYQTVAAGTTASSFGYYTYAKAFGSIAMGRYNDSIATSNKEVWIAADPLLILGNGTTDSTRSNALVVYKNGNTDINGFTQLGPGAPAIKMKKITGTNGASGATTFFSHGLTQSKILKVDVFINATSGNDLAPLSTYAGFEYDYYVSPTSIAIRNIAGNDASIAGRPIRIVITYEE